MSKTHTENKIAKKKQEAESTQNLPNPLNIYNPNAHTRDSAMSISSESSSMSPVALVSTDVQQLDEQITSMMNATENLMKTGNQNMRVWTCNVCGKEGQRVNIKTHIEANHINGNISYSCDICRKISRSRDGLRQHKTKEHFLQDQRRFEKTQIWGTLDNS